MFNRIGFFLSLFMVPAIPAAAQNCVDTSMRHGVRITSDSASLAEIYGQNRFQQTLPNGWRFTLLPQRYGWAVRVFDRAGENAVDLTSLTPPFNGVPNPRDIAGWHFRNADNTAANDGTVNAPQHRRVFFLSPSLAGTGGYKPSVSQIAPRHSAPDPAVNGMGWLDIKDFGLADLNPSEKARMVYLQFDACLIWPKTPDEIAAETDRQSTQFTSQETEIFGRCGLDLQRYALDAAFAPRMVSGDIDGDDAQDDIAGIKDRASGKKALAVCRAGTWLDIVGAENSAGENLLKDGFAGKLEAWSLVGKDHPGFGYEGAPAWPKPDGDVLVLERIEKEMIIVFWKQQRLQSQQIYRFVEP